jgi:large subunit ribosomal protein L6
VSRVGKKPIPLPSGIQVNLQGKTIRVKGPGGELTDQIDPRVKVSVGSSEIVLERVANDRVARSLHGLTRSHISNMVSGVSKGFQKTLEITGVGYRAQLQGGKIQLSVGFSHPVLFTLPAGIEAKIDKQTIITIKGSNKRLVGQVAANLRSIKPPEPYKGKGIRYSGEVIQRKEGKTGK